MSTFTFFSAARPGGARGPYRGEKVAVGTMHGKERQFAAAFSELLGARLTVPRGLDTDRFGTFTPEVVRAGTAVDTARAKAEYGMAAAGLDYGLASEASYGPLGAGGPGYEEVVLFADRRRELQVVEEHRGVAVFAARHQVCSSDELPPWVVAAMPRQALTVRPAGCADRAAIIKGVCDIDALNTAIAVSRDRAAEGHAVVEPDLRAHHNPLRRRVLRHLAWRLAERIATPCPDCGTPGYGRVRTVAGLPCLICRTPTALTLGEIHGCAGCDRRDFLLAGSQRLADPGHCGECNP